MTGEIATDAWTGTGTTAVTGAGGWPGLDVLEAQTAVLGELADPPGGASGLPFAVRLVDSGPDGGLTALGLSLLVDVRAELGPHGWRLSDRPGRDDARLASARRAGTDALAVAIHGWDGPLVVPVCGPVSLSAAVYLARGDRAVADHGAVADLVASSAAGVVEHLAAVRRAAPGARPVVLAHEPMLAAVLAGALPTFSGYARLRAVPGGQATGWLSEWVRQVSAAQAEVVLDVAAGPGALPVVAAAEPAAVGVRTTTLDERGWERVAEAVEGGRRLWAGVPEPVTSQCAGPDVRGVAEPLLSGWHRVGLPAAGLREVTLVAPGARRSQRPGAVGDVGRARAVLATTSRAAGLVAEHAEA